MTRSILYIDDDCGLLEINKLFLEKDNEFSVDILQFSEQAMGQIARQDYDAILSDYQMPGMDGIELLKAVRQEFGTIPFVLFTGKGREEIVIEALNNGADFYIQKGPDIHGMIAELKHVINRAIDRRQFEAELKKSRQQLHDIIDFLPDATCVIDTNGKVIAWNHAIEIMTGVPQGSMIGRGNYEYAIPLYGEARPLLMDRLLNDPSLNGRTEGTGFGRSGKILKGEGFLPRVYGGKGAYVSVSASILYDPGGNVTGAIETFRDVTDLHRIQHDLSISREMNRGFADLIPVAIYEMDVAGTLTFANAMAYEWFCIPKEEFDRRISVFDYVAPEDQERVARDIRNALAGTGGTGQEYTLRRKNETTFPALIYGQKITDPASERITGLRGVIVDLTERKKEAQALHESEERLKLAIRAGDIGIWEVNLASQTIRDLSEWTNRVLGYSIEETAFTVFRGIQFVNVLDMPRIFAEFRKYFNGIVPLFEVEFRARHANGSWRWVTIRGKAIELDKGGRPLRLTGTVNEIRGSREQRSS